jgi:excinuclease UvrABC nuclease subunit
MTTRSYILEFEGYWREPNISYLPKRSGVYGVYACTYDESAKTVELKRLLYLGEAANICDRVSTHDQWTRWRRALKVGEQICINAAMVSPEPDRQKAEAAMIFKHKPPCNTEYVDGFPFDTTTITTTGRNALMHNQFTVIRTVKVPTGLYRY